MLKGIKKANYQRNYMRRRRLKLQMGLLDPSVRPSVFHKKAVGYVLLSKQEMPELDSDGNPMPSYT